MRYFILLVPIAAVGCMHQPDYKAPPGHPAAVQSTVSSAPMAADPFTIKARPIEPAPTTAGQPEHGTTHADHDKPQKNKSHEMPDTPAKDAGDDGMPPHESHDHPEGDK